MRRATKCRNCQKATWAECGQHVRQVMAHVPRNERCYCDPNAPKGPRKEGGFFARLFGH